MMHELQCYMKGHRLPLVMLLAAMSYALSVIGGSTILPLPPIFWSVAPPITVDSALALMITAAVGIFATASLSAWENQSAQPWWIADMVVVMFLVAPSLLVSLLVSPESLIARNLCVYLILYFPLAAILSANAAIVMLAMWMVGQSAIYQYESGRIMWALTIILQKSSPLQVAAAAVGALGMWVIFRRKIKQQGMG